MMMMRQPITFQSIVRGWIFLIAIIFVALLWTACQTNQVRGFSKVEPNMTKDEVLDLVGSPIRTERYDGKEKWAYRLWLDGNVESLRQVTFVNGKVISVGEDLEEEQRLKEIQSDDSKRAEKRKQAKAKALADEQANPETPQINVEVAPDPEPAKPTESDFVEQKGQRTPVKTSDE